MRLPDRVAASGAHVHRRGGHGIAQRDRHLRRGEERRRRRERRRARRRGRGCGNGDHVALGGRARRLRTRVRKGGRTADRVGRVRASASQDAHGLNSGPRPYPARHRRCDCWKKRVRADRGAGIRKGAWERAGGRGSGGTGGTARTAWLGSRGRGRRAAGTGTVRGRDRSCAGARAARILRDQHIANGPIGSAQGMCARWDGGRRAGCKKTCGLSSADGFRLSLRFKDPNLRTSQSRKR